MHRSSAALVIKGGQGRTEDRDIGKKEKALVISPGGPGKEKAGQK